MRDGVVCVEPATLVDEAVPAPHLGQVLGLGELGDALEHFWVGLDRVIGQRETEVLHLLSAKEELLLVEGDPAPGAVGGYPQTMSKFSRCCHPT